MKLVDSQSNRHVVQFMNERQNRVYASAIAIPAYRTEVTDHTVINFYEAATGQAEPIRTWYYPGDNFGQEFVLSEATSPRYRSSRPSRRAAGLRFAIPRGTKSRSGRRARPGYGIGPGCSRAPG